MNYINLHRPSKFDGMSAAGSKLSDIFKLICKPHRNLNESISHFLNSITKKSIVLDIGNHNIDYLNLLIRISKRAQKLIAFETNADTYNYFVEKKELLKLKNLSIENLSSAVQIKRDIKDSLLTSEGKVIDFKTRTNLEVERVEVEQTLDNYFAIHNIRPDFLKINSGGNDLLILKGAIEMLKSYRPKVLLTCEERQASRVEILETFRLLTDLKYSGYFILDNIKIPLINFDFNIYQNTLSNFYCKDFIFE